MFNPKVPQQKFWRSDVPLIDGVILVFITVIWVKNPAHWHEPSFLAIYILLISSFFYHATEHKVAKACDQFSIMAVCTTISIPYAVAAENTVGFWVAVVLFILGMVLKIYSYRVPRGTSANIFLVVSTFSVMNASFSVYQLQYTRVELSVFIFMLSCFFMTFLSFKQERVYLVKRLSYSGEYHIGLGLAFISHIWLTQ